jgi:hypothetical protein
VKEIYGIIFALLAGTILGLSGCVGAVAPCSTLSAASPWQLGSNEIAPGVMINDIKKKELQ